MSVADVTLNFEEEIVESPLLADWETTAKIGTLKIASLLTDPICKVREYFYTFYILDKICDTSLQKIAKIALLTLGIIVFSTLSPLTTPLGVCLRGAVRAFSSKPYIYLERAKEGKGLPEDRKITLVSHNQCYMPAGFSITDGQVTPSSDRKRLDANIAMLKELNPDVICLYEVVDICDAEYLSSQLPEYPYLIPVAGIRAVGPSSMMYVASKYEIDKDSIEFTPFERGTELTGRGQFCEKGFLSFDLISRGEKEPFATVISTHLQHSEISEHPTAREKESRALQMEKIVRKIEKLVSLGKKVIFTGDLNQTQEELDRFFKERQIDWLRSCETVRGAPTWDGDQWCADLMGKPPSTPQRLDYAFVAGKGISIATQIFETGYASSEFREKASSDHRLLFNTMKLR